MTATNLAFYVITTSVNVKQNHNMTTDYMILFRKLFHWWIIVFWVYADFTPYMLGCQFKPKCCQNICKIFLLFFPIYFKDKSKWRIPTGSTSRQWIGIFLILFCCQIVDPLEFPHPIPLPARKNKQTNWYLLTKLHHI